MFLLAGNACHGVFHALHFLGSNLTSMREFRQLLPVGAIYDLRKLLNGVLGWGDRKG